jgi:multidrug resistance efflux pump
MSASQKRIVWLLFSAAVVAAVVVVFARPHDHDPQARADERAGPGSPTPVKAVHPTKNPTLWMTVQQLLTVEPFFETGLRAQVAGRVVHVPRSLGAAVTAGDLLVEIAVPDLDKEVSAKTAVIRQRQKDVDLARAQVDVADAQVKVAQELKEQRRHEVSQAEQTRDYRALVAKRLREAATADAINKTIKDEAERDYGAAYYAVLAAQAAERKAEADVKEKESIVKAARADVELKDALVQVAINDLAQAEARAGYARITAPFDGVITDHNVVAGTFVQNAATAHTEPMLTVARTDIVTAVMKVPDNFVRFVTRDTEAILRLDNHPGVEMHGRVTRFSPSIRNADRTMRVEVDLWNDTPARYQQFAARCVGTWLTPLAAPNPLNVATLMAGSDQVWSKNSKDRADPFPVLPVVTGGNDGPVTIVPGDSGYMRLNLRQFRNSSLLPSSAVYTRGGKPYILEVRDGKSHQLAVHVQVKDGRWAKVAVIVQEADPVRGQPEVLKPLTGDETVILNRQIEIGDGQPVDVTLEEP